MQRNLRTYLQRSRPSARTSSLLGVAALALAGAAVLANRRAAQAERDYLPKGRFVTVDGVRLHYVEKGSGPPVVFLHGNGADWPSRLHQSELATRWTTSYMSPA
jgi:hypothetical protein